jgi:hypothetical protein
MATPQITLGKLGRHVYWMVPRALMVFVDQKYTKETRGPKVS